MSAIPGRVLALWIVAPLLALGLAAVALGAPAADLRLLAQFLLLSEAASLALAWLGLRLMRRIGVSGIQAKMGLTYALGVVIVLLNIILSSMPMFFSAHDAGLLLILMIFGGLVALGFGQLMARSMTQGLEELADASGAIAGGDLERRVEVHSGDEVEAVGEAFNAMASRLDQAQRREAAAAQAQRSLIASASHDLRTPLTSLRATIEALAEGVVEDPGTVSRYLAAAQTDIRHLGRLVDDLFELTRLNTGALVPNRELTSVRDLVSDTLQSLHVLAAERGVALQGNVGRNVDPVELDPYLLQRALNNLVENAIRHTPAGGNVAVDGTRERELIRLRVSDNGAGIPSEDLPYVFDAFFRGEEARSRGSGEGAGLGLSITRAIVEAHGGTISVTSSEGHGAAFELLIPAREGSDAGAEKP